MHFIRYHESYGFMMFYRVCHSGLIVSFSEFGDIYVKPRCVFL